MRGIQGDIVIFALLISAMAHFGVMVYAKPKVMVSVAPSSVRAVRKGPMRVTEAVPPPEAVNFDMVEDVKAERDAPEASGDQTAAPTVDSNLPSSENDKIKAPEPEAKPSVAVEEVPEVFSFPSGPSMPRPVESPVLDVAPVPPSPTKAPLQPRIDVGVPLVPSFALPKFESSLPSAEEQGSENAKIAESANDAPAFTPVAEVMDEVSEKTVEAEKRAVKSLVDVSAAKELSGVVSMSLSKASLGEFTYFRVTVTPDAGLRTVPKDLVVLLDASGSIGKERMNSIRKAAKRLLRSSSNTGDRFNLVAFRDRFSYAFKVWRECTVASLDDADRWLDTVAPFGRTDVFATVASVLTLPRDPSRPLVALVVTDGEANEGVSATSEILSKFTALNDGLVSVYMYGVKSSANRELIDVLTRGNRGESFIFDGWSWKAGSGIEDLCQKFRDPVLSDLRVVFPSGCRAEAYPRLLRNLYKGSSVEIVGRVPSGVEEVSFSLKGLNGKNAYESFFRLPLSSAADDSRLVADWEAERSIDMKLR